MTPIEQWIRTVTNGVSNRAIGAHADLNHATLSRQLGDGQVSVEIVSKIARSYKTNPIPGLLAIGLITDKDLLDYSAIGSLRESSDEAIAAVVLERMKAGSKIMNAPISEVAHLSDHRPSDKNDNVTPLREDEMPETAVAYCGPDEDALREDDDDDHVP